MASCRRCGAEGAEGARFCAACGAALVGEPDSHDERKLVTVLFCDLVGSSSLTERLDPETLRGVLRRYFTGAREAVERHGGTVEKFIGDAVMAVFGVPAVHEDDALRAVRAAVELSAGVRALNEDLRRLGVELLVRIGIDTGEVVA